ASSGRGDPGSGLGGRRPPRHQFDPGSTGLRAASCRLGGPVHQPGGSSMTGPTTGPVLVAGGTGFVGRRLVEALVEAGREVRVMTRKPEQYRGSGNPVLGDVSKPDSLSGALEG